ncbi:MAG: anaerobic sulfatase-maturation protein [Alloprevotella sp.]
MSETATPFARPVYVMAKPVGAACNLACRYCYYTEKSHLYPRVAGKPMDEATLEAYIRQYIEMQTGPNVLFTWHGGEPMLQPLAFYRKALRLQRKYAGGRQIDNAFQTNGTLVTDEWARFFREHHFLVGVSIDGPAFLHDAYRQTRGHQPSHLRVMRGIETLNRYGVEWNAMAVVNNLTARHPLEFYRFFKEIDCHYLQFTPVVERLAWHPDGRHLAAPQAGGSAEVADFSVSPDDWGAFLCAVFDEWVGTDVGSWFVQIFDSTLAGWMGVPPGLCTLGETCGHAAVVEASGDVYACDHYVFPEYRLGNIHRQTLSQMLYGEPQQRFGRYKLEGLTDECRRCEFLMACHGECPRLRFAHSADGEPGHNWLCRGYRAYFEHVAPYMDRMKWLLQHGRPASDVMKGLQDVR